MQRASGGLLRERTMWEVSFGVMAEERRRKMVEKEVGGTLQSMFYW